MIFLTLDQILSKANSRPQGYVEDVISHAKKEGDGYILDDEAFAYLAEKYRKPSIMEQAISVAGSLKAWAKDGAELVSVEVLEDRLASCKSCDLWDPTGFGGSGRCARCGCSTQAKLRMATASCPLNPPKWGPVTQTQVS